MRFSTCVVLLYVLLFSGILSCNQDVLSDSENSQQIIRENCGISGIALFEKERDHGEFEFIRILMKHLLICTSKRGTDATGLVIFNKEQKPELYKKAKKGEKFVELSKFKKTLDKISADTLLIIGHNRAASVGSPKNNNNNHPVYAGSIYLVHNGDITNHKELTEKFGFNKLGEVDTEVIAHMINRYSEKEITVESIQKACAELEGSMALAFADGRDPTKLYLLRNRLPMTYAKIPPLGLLIFDSELTLIKKAWENAVKEFTMQGRKFDIKPFQLKDETELEENSGIIIDIKEKKIDEFDPFALKKEINQK
ncbi:MAG: hypothetical protein HY606_13280 [Planctomycetes bacterium]|nr:hypothetical protein [Planctomycetota bacterium]